MFYGKDSIEKQFTAVLKKLSEQDLIISDPMLKDMMDVLQKNTLHLYEQYQDVLQKNNLVVRKNREMEYGLRAAGKALQKSLAITKEMNDE